MGRMDDVTKFVKRFDPMLYCDSHAEGKLCVFRKSKRVESYDVGGLMIDFIRPAPYFVFALTDNWLLTGNPVDRGLEQIRDRLMKIDLWSRDLVKEIADRQEEISQSRSRDVDNHIESYLLDHRKEFARASNDVLTHSMKKVDRRKKDERKVKNGYR